MIGLLRQFRVELINGFTVELPSSKKFEWQVNQQIKNPMAQIGRQNMGRLIQDAVRRKRQLSANAIVEEERCGRIRQVSVATQLFGQVLNSQIPVPAF